VFAQNNNKKEVKHPSTIKTRLRTRAPLLALHDITLKNDSF